MFFKERYLDSALQSKLILLLQGDTDAGNSLASFMDDAMEGGEERRDMIEKKYAEHLAILYIYEVVFHFDKLERKDLNI